MGEVKLSTVFVHFIMEMTTDKEKADFMDEFVRLLIFRLREKRREQDIADIMRFAWQGTPGNTGKFSATIIGPHDTNEIRDIVTSLQEDAVARCMPVKFEYER
jgi:uncharacterized membrane-anchored protein YjiN (DUF445 family)